MKDIYFYIQDILMKEYSIKDYYIYSSCCKILYSRTINITKDMENTLNDIRIALFKYNNNLIAFQLLEQNLIEFDTIIKRVPRKNIESFITNHYQILTKIKHELLGCIEKNNSNKNKLIKYRDKIFFSKLQNIDLVSISKRLTRIFNEFMKGITYYENERVFDEKAPIYHRSGSCVSKGNSNKKCDGMNNEITSKEIEKCYLERLVYDKMWTEVAGMQQDEGHLRWLTDTREAYNTCFPNCEIEIEFPEFPQEFRQVNVNNSHLRLLNDVVPTKMMVRKYNNGKLLSTETYTKTYDYLLKEYVYPVDCIKQENGHTFMNSSNFTDVSHEWVLVGGRKRKTKKQYH